ncbi:acyl carrier protein [Streptomyces galilaeus]|uniref:acyl carrier protein n=1 Tax=Streptomyces galilaeus TaxID=33899 RepID=UPI0038F6B60D
MSAEVRKALIDALQNMHFAVVTVADDTPLGDGGLELESLSMAELVMQVESFGVEFSDEEMEKLTAMTFGEFAQEVARRAAEK